MNTLYQRVKALLASASDAQDYNHAKVMAEGCSVREQFDLIDDFIAVGARLRKEGCLA